MQRVDKNYGASQRQSTCDATVAEPDTISVSAVPARPACISHADNSAKRSLLMTELYSATNYQEINLSKEKYLATPGHTYTVR